MAKATARTGRSDQRDALVRAAAELLAGGTPLTARRLSEAAGTSTMGVYTYFGGIAGVRRAVRLGAFNRLAQLLGAVPPSDDPVADLSALGQRYIATAVGNPQLYRLMFMEPLEHEDPDAVGQLAQPVVYTVLRCMAAGRFSTADETALTSQLWIMTHGIVSLAIASAIRYDDVLDHLSTMAANLYVSFGDDRNAAQRSIDRARRTQHEIPSLLPDDSAGDRAG